MPAPAKKFQTDPLPEPWSDSRFWIVMDWAIAWASAEDFESIHLALKEGAPRGEFDRLARAVRDIPGYCMDAPDPLQGLINSSASPMPHPPEPDQAPQGKDGRMEIDFSQVKVLDQPHPPHYPKEALGRKLMTNLVLRIVIDPQGKPVCSRPLPGPWLGIFAPTGIAYGMKWRFRAAELNGVPQYSGFRLTMPFRLRN